VPDEHCDHRLECKSL